MLKIERDMARKKKTQKLDEDRTVLLMSYVQSKNCLWDESHADFKKVSITKKLWNEIGTQLNITGDEAKLKWQKLKGKFKKLLRTRLEGNKGPESSPAAPSWKFYNSMLFLKDGMRFKAANSNASVTSNNTSRALSSEQPEENDDDFEEFNFDFFLQRTSDKETSRDKDDRSTKPGPRSSKKKIVNNDETIDDNQEPRPSDKGTSKEKEVGKPCPHSSTRIIVNNDETIDENQEPRPSDKGTSKEKEVGKPCPRSSNRIIVNNYETNVENQEPRPSHKETSKEKEVGKPCPRSSKRKYVSNDETDDENQEPCPSEKETNKEKEIRNRKPGSCSSKRNIVKNDETSGKNQEPEKKRILISPTIVHQDERKGDDDHHFLLSLMPYIQALDPVEKLELRSQMQNLVTASFKKHEVNKCSRKYH